jgi:pimeloyl-ACP methyl ester carboxylesterase
VIAWDAPGAGGSSDPPESFGTAGYADALAGFVAALGLDTPHVVGLSFGGILALALYRRHPGVPRTLTGPRPTPAGPVPSRPRSPASASARP